jgi:endonuclease III
VFFSWLFVVVVVSLVLALLVLALSCSGSILAYLTMPTLVQVAVPTMKLHITAERLLAAKGLLRVDDEDVDVNDEDEDEDEDEENEEYMPPLAAPAVLVTPPPLTSRARPTRQTRQTTKKRKSPAEKAKDAKSTKRTPTTILPTPRTTITTTIPPDGSFETWEAFVDCGGYDITKIQAQTVKAWVKSIDPVWISDQVKFHKAIFRMRSELEPSSRDGWANVLPKRHALNFDFCCLILMVATPSVPDTKILDVFGKLFRDNYVDAKWVLEQGESKLQAIFAPLGRQKDTARYVTGIARAWQGMPRDYRLLLGFPGVGPKVALVTIDECFKDAQGVPCDIHMVRIFKTLGWMPTTISLSDSWGGGRDEPT